MRDKTTILFPSLLFAVFFVLITITGIIQIKIVQNNLDGLLKGQGEILFNHVRREIDINLEYLSLLDTSPSIITPNFLNILVYDEAIVEDLYGLLAETPADDIGKLPIQNILVLDEKGKNLASKGEPKVTVQNIQPLVSRQQETFIKMPTTRDQTLVIGLRSKGSIYFLSIDEDELEGLRKKVIIKSIVENEGKRLDVSRINIFDAQGELYSGAGERKGNAYLFARPLDSKFLQGYRMEIFLSRTSADEIFKQTTRNFVLVLVFLVLSGALSAYIAFLLARKYDRKVKEMERDMEMKDRLVSLGKLASGMAHEIRNPLNAISISIQRLKREFVPGDDKKDEYGKFIDIMRGELRRVDRIVEEFLLSTKSRAPFFPENLYEVMEYVVTMLLEKAAMKGVALFNDIDKDVQVECQPERIKQAFYNLLLNGIEAITGKGVVEIASVHKGTQVHISIVDNGSGITEEHIHSIFDYYYTTKDKGVGLGLPISYMIVKDHGGDIKVSSEKGKGTRFVVSLPLVQPKAENSKQ